MSYEAQAAATLQAAVDGVWRATHLAGSRLARARSEAAKASDLVAKLAATIDLLVAMESLHDAADAACKSLRATLTTTMSETGATRIDATHHVASLARKPAYLDVSAEARIPEQFWIQPPRAIDQTALKSALKDGVSIEGVNRVIPNEMQLRITANKERV